MNLSNKAIDRIGGELAKGNKSDQELLEQLQLFRVSHKLALSKVFNAVCEKSTKIRKAAIVTYRIKRIDSIIKKLERLPNRKLSKMGDIGGCRCIVKNDSQVYKLRDEIGELFPIRKENDYIKNPTSKGYKSLHLYLDVPSENKQIELQIRNQVDHNWATLVEISDVIFDAGLKEYSKDQRLLQFHLLLSKNSLDFDEMRELASIIDEYDYIEKLSDVFYRNNNEVRKQWMKIENNPSRKFFLIESAKNKIPIIQSYETFESSEEAYFKSYLKNDNSNILLTHLPTPNYEQISTAYSNYILTFHSFIEKLFVILKSLIKKALVNEEVFRSISYFNLYFKANSKHYENLISEVQERIIYHKNSNGNKNNKLSSREKAWDKKIMKDFAQLSLEMSNFKKIVRSNIPNSFFKRHLLLKSFNYLARKYYKKVQTTYRNINSDI